jgi:hypothetical protein
MSFLVRFGLVFWLLVRMIFAIEKLRTRFTGDPVTIGETPILYKMIRNKQKKVTSLAFGIVVPDTLCFTIRKEKYFDRVAKVLGIASEFQTGDRAFDQQAYILCEDQTLLRALAVNAPLRKAVAALLDTGDAKALRCNAGRLWIECPAKAAPNRSLNDHAIVQLLGDDVAPKLATMRDVLTPLRAESWTPERDPHVARERFFYVLAVALIIIALCSFIWSMGLGFPRSLLFDNAERLAVNTAVLGTVIFVAAAFFMLRGTSRLHLVLLEILLTMAPASWYVGRVWYAEQNVRQDHSTEEQAIVRIAGHYISSGRRNSKSYFLQIEGWPDSRIPSRFQVHADLYNAAAGSPCAQVVYHRGRYGDPWIESMRPTASCDPGW